MAATPQEATPVRRPYSGSCHCGAVRYIAYLTLPHVPAPVDAIRDRANPVRPQRFYRCNCTVCHKAGILHVRVPHAPDDFCLLSPRDPLRELADYTCNDGRLHFYFCRTCGVRCFSFAGEGELVEKEVPVLPAPPRTDGASSGGGPVETRTTTVWAPKRGWVEGGRDHQNIQYLSINGYTLDAGQEGLDLREWTEKKWVEYADWLSDSLDMRYEQPYPGGAY